MAASPETSPEPIRYLPGFRPRRGLNWGFIGLLYTSFYMCRYNFSVANKAISDEYGFTRAEMGKIITTALIAYAFGQIINGLLADRIGGKKAMLIGAAGTVIMNILFGAASLWWVVGADGNEVVRANFFGTEIFMKLLTLFVAIRGVDGYMQSFGAPGMVKINAAWFGQRERGRFAGIFGFMINLGRFGIFKLGPALLAGFTFLGMMQIPPLHWRWLFWVPSGICAIIAVGVIIFVKETPEAAGFHGAHAGDDDFGESEVRSEILTVLKTIASNPIVWIVALSYACTGAVRQAVDQWFPRYMQEHHSIDLKSASFQVLAFMIPFVASAGSLISGYISDTLFKGRRAPVAAFLFFLESAVIFLAATLIPAASRFGWDSGTTAIVFLLLISLTANSTHSILGTAAAMDIGGRKMAGFASGLINSFQYFGGSLAGYFLGKLLDKNWDYYFYFMIPFGIIGGLLMLVIRGRVTLKAKQKPPPSGVIPAS